jgi:hypothetical protein
VTTKDARAAARKNAKAAAQAPLLAYAGLVEQTTAEQEQARRLAAVTAGWWQEQERRQNEAQTWALVGWLRACALTMLGQEDADRVERWVESCGTTAAYVWRARWAHVLGEVLAGRPPIPEAGMIAPSACWPDLFERRHEWHAAIAEHDAAGCTKERCVVRDRGRPAAYVPGEAQTW